ncbi:MULTISPECIES: DUF4031 domain-containing protein [unclassified Arthrobacter]|uniref:DUF4031 domain-containing protein n=1 Tax=unclassified Arthrobacter TaxID=235627 RepID=UPI001D153D28|nr:MULTISPECIES: DUF4031 domain-containing protein [unclassified Arthrobacter]MCC3275562.1 DUF4031 domain-containing protein [Arthrobacter sp. zg-Y20]MCC9177003.1 DUF4031 domain-containing protein [Arthrobacter sp. zg-Y750]MDK1315719.1 DUF4031 domain-containing protein [Arthrobacter sp. zg.Y20]WIB06127.1 DUF4031 domain-containing protein [Arthrobacter sp. zg-Y20]
MIYIDPPMWPAHNTLFSHLVSDTSVEELHAFAQGAGISPRAFDGDHYDVPQHLHRKLVRRGAVAVTGGELVRILIGSGLRIPARERPSALAGPLLERWNRLLPGRPELGGQLLDRWNEPHRRYHDRRHLLQVLEALDLLTGSSVPRPVALAAWFHDAVYACRPGEDEEASACLAEDLLAAAGEDPAAVAECARLVRLTAAHAPDPGDHHGALLVDADLSVLARDPARYRSYRQAVRAEYAHLSAEDFRAGRRRVVAHLAAAEPLFCTEAGRRHWEARARHNLGGELSELGSELSGHPGPAGPGSGDRP